MKERAKKNRVWRFSKSNAGITAHLESPANGLLLLCFMGYTKKEIIVRLREQGIAVGRDAVESLKGLPSVVW